MTETSASWQPLRRWGTKKTSPSLRAAAEAAKQDAIMACLHGSDHHTNHTNVDKEENVIIDTVNLWQLRELALSRGGLLGPEFRKRAWPKLVAMHERMQMSKHATNQRTTRAISRRQLQVIQLDLCTAVWNVQEELRHRKEARQVEQEAIDARAQEFRLRHHRKVTFAPSAVTVDHVDGSVEEIHLDDEDMALLTPTSTGTDGEEEPELVEESSSTTRYSHTDTSTGAMSPSTVATHEVSVTSLFSNASTISSRAIRGRQATIPERRILYMIISNLLIHTPAEIPETYTYHPGFQDLVALFLFNLESPTLTNMVLQQVAAHHWRHQLAPTESPTGLKAFLSATFMPLLGHFDARLAQHLQEQGLGVPRFCRDWAANWLASNCGEAAAASRFLDVLLVSHPYMIIYLCVAFVLQARRTLLSIHDYNLLARKLRSLPVEATTPHEDDEEGMVAVMDTVEEIIARALHMIENFPPSALQNLAENLDPQCSVTLDEIWLPDWATASVAPSDWAIIDMQWNVTTDNTMDDGRMDSLLNSSSGSKINIDPREYPLACHALGLSSKRASSRRWVRPKPCHILLFLILASYAALVGVVLTKGSRPPVATLHLGQPQPRQSVTVPALPAVMKKRSSTVVPPQPTPKDNTAAVSPYLWTHWTTWWRTWPRTWQRWWRQQKAFWDAWWKDDNFSFFL